jgi:hypothetical protein
LKKTFLVCLVITLLTILTTTNASALYRWYAGYYQTSAYGAKADISIPSTAPFIGDGGQSHWVSTEVTSGSWAQTGWHYNNSTPSYARNYTEICLNWVNDQDDWGIQSWGTTNNYRVNRQSTVWMLYIGGVFKYGYGSSYLPTPPCKMMVETEMQDTVPTNPDTVDSTTYFNNVQWMNSGGSWSNFSQWWNQRDDPPYNSSWTLTPNSYQTWGPD